MLTIVYKYAIKLEIYKLKYNTVRLSILYHILNNSAHKNTYYKQLLIIFMKKNIKTNKKGRIFIILGLIDENDSL